MALNWNWDNKIGKAIYNDGTEVQLYRGNAYIIACREWDDNGQSLFSVSWFAVNRNHMKDLLGISKESDENVLAQSGITDIILYNNYKYAADLTTLILKSGWGANLHVQPKP